MTRSWPQKIQHFVDPLFVPRWIVYKESLKNLLNPESFWIDCGCGDNSMVRELKHLCKFAVGIDIEKPENDVDFIKAEIGTLPFPENYADVITLRFVVEHLSSPEDLRDILRVLKPGGKLLFITTNLRSPFVAIPKLIPYRLRNKLISTIFKVNDSDVFPTFHRFNTPTVLRRSIPGFTLESIRFLSDLNSTRSLIFLIYLAWHVVTMPNILRSFRANILAVYTKNSALQ